MIAISLRRSLVVCRSFHILRMASTNRSYEEAVRKLNSLQSNRATLDQIRKAIKSGQEKNRNIEEMVDYLSRTGVSLTQLDELSVIHVAGTKGKGSTSAMCESILRSHGVRTGLFTSPHLVAVRERIRLDGKIVAPTIFASHFHDVYDILYATRAHEGDMPKYFAFLTVMAFNMFLKEKVDVAIVEVGIGGVVDYTNVLRKVPVVGITALGLDHTSILGDKIEQIAAAKAGIMKPGCEAYTVTQPTAAMEVLERVAADVQCPLKVIPDYGSYEFPKNVNSNLPVDIDAYKMNASLAVQLAHAWLRISRTQMLNRRNIAKKQVVSGKIRQNEFLEIDTPFIPENKFSSVRQESFVTSLPIETLIGLRECRWPGRYQVVKSDYAMFYLDGAHTKESMEICAKWFQEKNRFEEKIMIFSATGDRDVEVLLKPLTLVKFSTVIFVIPQAYKSLTEKSDNYSKAEHKDLVEKCQNNANVWQKISNSESKVFVLECVSDALIHIKRDNNKMNSVLITGSLHLVGAALSILDPSLSIE